MCFQFGRRVPHGRVPHGRLTFNVYHLNTLDIFMTHIRPLTHPKPTMFILLLFLLNFMTALSAPILEPHNAQETTHWVSAPATRGTFGILLSCTLTLFLCLWSSLHLNIPHRDDGPKQNLRKVKYTLLALLAPELVVFIAWRQYSSATAVVAEVNKIFEVCPFPH